MDGTIPVDISLTPRKRHALTAGAGVTTDAGPRLRLGYENRWATPGGHRWSVRSAASLIKRSLDAEYRIPLEDPRTEWLNLHAGAVREHTDASRSDAASLGVAHTKPRWGDWLETRFVSLTYDDFAVGRTRGTARLLTPGASLATTRYDNRHRPDDGYRLHSEIRGSHEAAGSGVSLLRVSGSIALPRVTMRLTGQDMRYQDWGARLLEVDADVSEGRTTSRAVVKVADWRQRRRTPCPGRRAHRSGSRAHPHPRSRHRAVRLSAGGSRGRRATG